MGLMDPIYWSISWIMLRWHELWDAIGLEGTWLGTNWDWILAIVFLVITVRIIIFPLFVKQIRSQRAMQALQPQVKALQEKHKGDRETMQKELMTLYKSEGANPLMGCLPLLLQMPVFFGVFHVIKGLVPNGPARGLYGWTGAQFDSAAAAKLFGVTISATFNQGGAARVLCGILGVVMIVTTYLTSRQMILKTGWSEDPTQKMIQRMMLYGIPLTLIISAVAFPLGLIIYWTTSNLFSLGQQMWVLKKYPPPKIGAAAETKGQGPVDLEAAKALAPKVGAKPTTNPKAPTSPKAGSKPGAGAAETAEAGETKTKSSTSASGSGSGSGSKGGASKGATAAKSAAPKRKSVKKNVG